MAVVPGSPRKGQQKDYTEYPSTEPIDEGHVKFQSAEKSAGASTKKLLQLGFTSIQEQPHKFARPNRKHSEEVKSPNRQISQSHFAAVRGNFVEEVKGKLLMIFYRWRKHRVCSSKQVLWRRKRKKQVKEYT